MFRCAEDFVGRFDNVGEAGFNYFMFAPRKACVPPLYLNTRVYSCILLRNYLPFRWRGRYNEDTDLSLRILKAGLCTMLFMWFVCDKQRTMVVKGGNTPIYQKGEGRDGQYHDGRLMMAQSLYEQHPDVVKITRKFGRWHHHVDYRPFKNNRLILREGVEIPQGVNNYGMKLVNKADLATGNTDGDKTHK